MKRILSLLLLLTLASPAGAAQEIVVSDGATVPVTVSQRELTRLALADGGKLARVWGVDGQFTVQADDEAGEAFIRPVEGTPIGNAFSLFVRDAEGATYTLTATVSDLPAQTVLLKPQGHRKATPKAQGVAAPHVEQIKAQIRAMLDGDPETAEGCTVEAVGRAIPLWRETYVEIVRRWHCEAFSGEELLLRNVSSAELRLDEHEFEALYPDVRAVAIPWQVLAPQGATPLLLLRDAKP
ncbi:MAG: TraK domain-containing protein [Panacagrimonas sp.]